MGNNYVPLFASFGEMIALLSDEKQLKMFWAILRYGTEGIEPQFDSTEEKIAWCGIRPVLDSTERKRLAKSHENAGPPLGNQNARKQSKTIEINQNNLEKEKEKEKETGRGGAPIGNQNRRIQPNSTQFNHGKEEPFVLTDEDIKKLRG